MLVSALAIPSFPRTLSPSPSSAIAKSANILSFFLAPTRAGIRAGPSDGAPEMMPSSPPRELHARVEEYVEYFTTDGRELLQGWLDRSAIYYPMMRAVFRGKNLPEDLAYIAMIESGFNPHAVSEADATGPWQFVDSTAKQYGLRMDAWVDERRDPVKSTRAAAEHLHDLHNRFGSWSLALASYNAGALRVQQAVQKAQSKDFWTLLAAGYIPRETRNYVPKYLASVIIASAPVAYGFSLPSGDPFTYEEIAVPNSTDLGLIALFANTTVKHIKRLNPELRRGSTPPDMAPYVLRLPKGANQALFFAALFENRASLGAGRGTGSLLPFENKLSTLTANQANVLRTLLHTYRQPLHSLVIGRL